MTHSPFFLKPSAKSYLWGGAKLNQDFSKDIELDKIAETWECSTHPDGPSYIVGGQFEGMTLSEVIKLHPEFLGENHESVGEFPILVKLIDAKQDLSVQVHPDDEYVRKHENGRYGKAEMWYVLGASKDAKLVYGLERDCDEQTVRDAVKEGNLEQLLHYVPIRKNDVFYIKPGTIHGIGAGTLIAEIQENSNYTYRLYDYDRKDANGQKRELHLDKALEVADLSMAQDPRQPIRVLKYSPGKASDFLCRCHYFEVYRMMVNTERRQKVYYQADRIGFRVLLCTTGCGILCYDGEMHEFYKGDCIFVPANSSEIRIHGKAEFLDIRG